MDTSRIFELLGELYARTSMQDEMIKKLRLQLQAKDEEIGLLRATSGGSEPTRIPDK